MAQWIRPRTLSREVAGSNLLPAATAPLGHGQGTLSSCLVPRKGLKSVGPSIACF